MEEGGNNNSFGRNFNFFKSTEAVISKPLEAIGRIFEQLENFGEGGEKEKERESRAEGERDFGKGSGRALSIRSNRSGRSGRGMREDYLGGGESGRGGEGGRRSGEFGVVEEERLRGELVAIDASVEQQRLSSLDVSSFFLVTFVDSSLENETEIETDVIANDRHSRISSLELRCKYWKWCSFRMETISPRQLNLF